MTERGDFHCKMRVGKKKGRFERFSLNIQKNTLSNLFTPFLNSRLD